MEQGTMDSTISGMTEFRNGDELLDIDSLVSDRTIKSCMKYFTKRIEFYLWARQEPEWPSRFMSHDLSTHKEWQQHHSHALGSLSLTTYYLLGFAHLHGRVEKELNRRAWRCVNGPHQIPLGSKVQRRLM